MQPYKIQPRIYRGFIYILVILKVERCGEIFLLIHSILRHRIYRGFTYILLILKVAHCGKIFLLIHSVLRHRTSREEMKEITLEHMTHITSILQVGVGEEGKYAYQRPARVRRCGGSAPGVRPRGDAVESGRGGAVGPCRGRAEGRGRARPRRGWPRGRRRRGSGTGHRCSGMVPGIGDWARRVWSGD